MRPPGILAAPPASCPRPKHRPPYSQSLRWASIERRQVHGLKKKGDRFASCCVLYSIKCALNTDSCSDTSASLLSEICKGLRQEGDKGQHFLDFFSLTGQLFSRNGFLTFFQKSPHTALCTWTYSLGPLGLVKSVLLGTQSLLCSFDLHPPPALA